MSPDLPFWIRQRQARVEEVSQGSFRISGPNLPEAVVSVAIDDSLLWKCRLQEPKDQKEVAATPPEFDNPRDALDAGFELYRGHFIS